MDKVEEAIEQFKKCGFISPVQQSWLVTFAESALEREAVDEEDFFKVIYDIERKSCASEKCLKTCPAYKNQEKECGIMMMARELAHALSEKFAKPVMDECPVCGSREFMGRPRRCAKCNGTGKAKPKEVATADDNHTKRIRND